ncbi:hypothetical protein [Actinoplanes sp. NPDC049265]|uniref:hypothetical protein n=1 Tax=Actinoplanes sp. NPDC049265 TaxID=3363902 RepID=UPI0037193CE4
MKVDFVAMQTAADNLLRVLGTMEADMGDWSSNRAATFADWLDDVGESFNGGTQAMEQVAEAHRTMGMMTKKALEEALAHYVGAKVAAAAQVGAVWGR